MMRYVGHEFTPKPVFEEETQQQQTQQQQTQQQQTQLQKYNEFRNTYKINDCIPVNHINTVILHHFPNDSNIIYDYNITTKLIKIKIIDILNANICNWEFNREPDIDRIPLIAQNIYETRLIKTILCFNYEFKNDKFEIIDGSHRYEALKLLYSFKTNINDRINWFINEDIDWLLNEYILVQIYFESNIEQLIELRNNINHSKPMPVEYEKLLNDREKNNIIKQIYIEYHNRYKKCFGNGKDENMRNSKKMDRDRFYVILSKVYDKYNININRVGLLQNKLNIANQKIKDKLSNGEFTRGLHKCNNKSILKRCEDTKCYLFLYDDDYLAEFI
jgi:hypothetical protein